MLIVALILAVIGLAALVTAVATSNELIAWVCIGASGLGILFLIVDAVRDRSRRKSDAPAVVAAAVPAAEAEITEVIEPVEHEEIAEHEELAEDEEVAEDEGTSDDEDFSHEFSDDEEIAEHIAEEDHPDELVYEDPDYDMPSDDEAEFPEPAEEAAIHAVSDEAVSDDAVPDDAVPDDAVPEDFSEAIAEDLDIEEYLSEESAIVDDEAAVEVRYVASSEDSAPSVSYTYSESAETEDVDSEEREDRRDS